MYIYIICTKENRLPTNKNVTQTERVSASTFIRGLHIGLINPLMISYYDVIKKKSYTIIEAKFLEDIWRCKQN